MRTPEYISPSAYKCWRSDDAVEYYRRYLADTRPPRFPQNQAMASGSAFDAYCKSYLHNALFGANHKDSAKYSLKALFEAQVESPLRDWAWPVGAYLFREYQDSGALADLMIELQGAVDDPNFEFELKGEVHGRREGADTTIKGVVLMGKPDVRFINSQGAHVIYDWKVNGFCGKGNTSPKPGYTMLRDKSTGFWQRKGAHKDCLCMMFQGMQINTGSYLETIESDWAIQTTTYAWLMGEQVGTEIVVGIDQMACNGTKLSIVTGYPEVRIASHRTRVSEKFQLQTFAGYQELWNRIHSNPFHFFRELSLEESQLKCQAIENETKMASNPNTPSDVAWALGIARPH